MTPSDLLPHFIHDIVVSLAKIALPFFPPQRIVFHLPSVYPQTQCAILEIEWAEMGVPGSGISGDLHVLQWSQQM